MITLSDLLDFPTEGNSQGEILGFQVIYSQQSNFVPWQYCRKVRFNVTEKSGVYQGCLVLCAYLVDILWFAGDQFRISVFYI
jgi:hypothetical protein